MTERELADAIFDLQEIARQNAAIEAEWTDTVIASMELQFILDDDE